MTLKVTYIKGCQEKQLLSFRSLQPRTRGRDRMGDGDEEAALLFFHAAWLLPHCLSESAPSARPVCFPVASLYPRVLVTKPVGSAFPAADLLAAWRPMWPRISLELGDQGHWTQRLLETMEGTILAD
jgi:hypothetical protein